MTSATLPFSYLHEPAGAHASDWHLCPGAPPRIRVQGAILPITARPITEADLIELQRAAPSIDAPLSIEYYGAMRRFRVHRFTANGQPCATLRLVPPAPPRLETITDLPRGFTALLEKPEGLILVGGATGAGKSTTLAAAIDALNRRGGTVILTLEDPIEFTHVAAKDSVIYQCAFGGDFQDWSDALKHGLRKDPDIILVGEMRDRDTIHAALHAANTGHLVFASVHGGDVPGMVDRIVAAFAAVEREEIAALLANTAIGFLAQKLVPATDGERCALFEFMPGTIAAKTTIRENRLHQLAAVIRTGGRDGMQSFDYHLERLLARKRITAETAKIHHTHPEDL
jgi:twitching motility protein PilT